MNRDLPQMLHIGETCRSCTRASECTPKHGLPSPQTTARPRLLNTITHTRTHNHQSQLQTQAPKTAPLNQRSKTLTWCIAARQPSIRSKPQRMKRDLPKMLHVGETCRTCTRASECTPKHGLPSPQPQHAPASFKTITHTQARTTTNHKCKHKHPQPHPSINVQNTHSSHCSTSAFNPIKASTHET